MQCKTRGLDNVTFTGLIPHEEIKHYLAATDISLVVLKKSDLFLTVIPSKIFESLGAKKPVILGVDGEAKEVLEESGGGVAVPPEDPIALTDAILYLVDNPSIRERFGLSGQTYVKKEYNRKIWALRYLHILSHWALK